MSLADTREPDRLARVVYTIQRQNEQLGPYTLEAVRDMAQSGQLLPTDLAWPEGATGPMTVSTLMQVSQSDATGGMIPYKNGAALTAYYLAVASLIPCLGLLTGIPAFFLGLKGLKKVKAEPWVRGTAHAWIGVVGGGAMVLLNLAGIAFMAFSIWSQSKR
jgi:hypothetical protein